MQHFITKDHLETQALGKKVAAQLQKGDVILLNGEMGAGKSEFSRGIARGLGIAGPVPSPSFTIMNVYDEGILLLYHFDWYRIKSPEELYEMGMDEYIGGDGIALIEWFERAPEIIPEKALEVRIIPINENEREITLIPRGNFRTLEV